MSWIMGNTNQLLSSGFISRIHAQSLSALVAVQGTGRLASSVLVDRPGAYRRRHVIIKNSQHVPPPAENVPHLVQVLCEHLNSNWPDLDPVDIACIVLWRINWIHPFRDGNGRTARAVTRHIIARCYKLKINNAFDQRIIANRTAYYHALRSEDDNQGDSSKILLPSATLHAFMRAIITEQISQL